MNTEFNEIPVWNAGIFDEWKQALKYLKLDAPFEPLSEAEIDAFEAEINERIFERE